MCRCRVVILLLLVVRRPDLRGCRSLILILLLLIHIGRLAPIDSTVVHTVWDQGSLPWLVGPLDIGGKARLDARVPLSWRNRLAGKQWAQ